MNEPPAHVVTPDDEKRLDAQSDQILALLMRRPATNAELSEIALKYTSRVSDLRKRGYNIKCKRLKGGTTEYRLEKAMGD